MRRLTAISGAATRTNLCAATIVVAAIVLFGWGFDIGLAKTVLPGLTTMKANTAVCLVLCAVALLDVVPPSIGTIAACLAVAIGGATLAEYVAGRSVGLDELLVADPDTTSMPFPGRMSPASALAFVATGAGAVALRTARSRRLIVAAHACAALPGSISYLSLVGYIYGVERLYNFGPYVSVAVNTSAGLGMLAAAMLLTRSREGWTRPFAERPIATEVLARLIVIALVLPFAVGLLIVAGGWVDLYKPQYGPAAFAVLASLAMIWLALRAALAVRGAEGEALGRGRALEASEARYRLLLDNLPQLVWTARADGTLLYVGEKWRAFTGDAPGPLPMAWLEAVHPEDRERIAARWSAATGGEQAYDVEFRLRRDDGAHRWFKAVAVPIPDDGDATIWIGSHTDIQDIVDARDVLSRSNEDLETRVAQRTQSLMAVEEQLRQSQKMEAVGQLTGGLAHDFNNLLAGITGSLDLMQARVARGRLADVPRFVEAAQDAARRAAALTHRLLAFSRRQTLLPRAVDMNRLVFGMEEMIRRTMGPSIQVEIVAAPDLGATLIDAGQLENALLNLCINARDAMPDGGRVTIATANERIEAGGEAGLSPGAYVALRVGDTGTGMAPEIVERAFDPFFTTKPTGLGTGLGLSMIFGFTQQSGGIARIASEVGRGTIVSLVLPRASEAAEAAETAGPRAAPVVADAGHTVLVVDDEPTVRMLLVEVLEDLGCRVFQAETGAQGLAALRGAGRVDLLITDVGLPGGMNGRQMADAALTERPDLKVLFVTGYAETTAIGPERLGPNMDVVMKPFVFDELIGRIATLLGEPAEAGAEPEAADAEA